MFARIGLAIHVGLREPLFVLIGTSGGALAMQEGVSAYIAIPVALLVACQFSIRRWRR